jgi:hypothetical protein
MVLYGTSKQYYQGKSLLFTQSYVFQIYKTNSCVRVRVQQKGPFTEKVMRVWLEQGHLQGDLPISQVASGPFRPLSDWFAGYNLAYEPQQFQDANQESPNGSSPEEDDEESLNVSSDEEEEDDDEESPTRSSDEGEPSPEEEEDDEESPNGLDGRATSSPSGSSATEESTGSPFATRITLPPNLNPTALGQKFTEAAGATYEKWAKKYDDSKSPNTIKNLKTYVGNIANACRNALTDSKLVNEQGTVTKTGINKKSNVPSNIKQAAWDGALGSKLVSPVNRRYTLGRMAPVVQDDED